MSMDAPTMDVLRKQAIAMVMLWLTARDYQHEGGEAWFHVRARDLGLRDDVLPGKRIRVTIQAEPDTPFRDEPLLAHRDDPNIIHDVPRHVVLGGSRTMADTHELKDSPHDRND